MILTHKNGGPSARLLRDSIEEVTGTRLFVTQFPEKIKKLHIRWGNYAELPMETKYTSREVIMRCTYKRRFSKLLTEAGIPAPIFHNKTMPTEDDFPIIIRQIMGGKCGKGIVPCPDMETFLSNWKDSYFWTKFVNCSAEYRAHVFDGEVIRIFKKVYIGEGTEGDFPIRNWGHSDNYKNSLRSDLSKFPKLLKDIKRVAKVIGEGYYAVDVGWLPDEKKYFYFEGNSAPGLNTKTALELARRFHKAGVV